MSLQAMLAAHSEHDLTAQMLRAVFGVIPYAPDLGHYASVEAAARALDPDWTAAELEQLAIEAGNEDLADVVWMANLIDTGDLAYTAVTGIMAAYRAYSGEAITDVLETDPQQRNDAVAKALALAYMANRAFPGTVSDKVEAFRQVPAGQAIAMYYAAIEIALPFADNVLTSNNFLDDLVAGEGSGEVSRLAALAGRPMDAAATMLSSLTGGLQKVAAHAVRYAGPVARTAQAYLPGAVEAVDKGAGIAASAADMLPVYSFLGVRLAAEAAAWRVKNGHHSTQEALVPED